MASEAGMRESIPVIVQPITKFTQSERKNQLIPGVNSLGWGYRVLSAKYADSEGLTQSLFNLGKMEKENVFGKIYNRPKHVSYLEIEKYEFKTIAGKSIEEYETSLAVSAEIKGKYGAFKGSVKSNFNTNEISISESSFVTVYGLIQKWRLQIPYSRISDLSSKLLDKVRKDLNDNAFEAKDLFNAYGTHFLTGIIVGARVNYSNSVAKITKENEYNLSEAASLSYNEVIEGKGNVVWNEKNKKFKETNVEITKAIGGNSILAHKIKKEGGFDEWAKSVETNPVFIDFARKSILPIWELCESPDRQKYLQEAFEKLVEKYKLLDFGYSGGGGGIEFKDYVIPQNSTVKEVIIRSGEYVDAIGIVHRTAEGTSYPLDMHGGGGGVRKEFRLEPNEYITEINGRYGEIVDSIQIHTNRKVSPKYGGSGGNKEYRYIAPEGTEVVGFYGRSGTYLDAIGIVFRQHEK